MCKDDPNLEKELKRIEAKHSEVIPEPTSPDDGPAMLSSEDIAAKIQDLHVDNGFRAIDGGIEELAAKLSPRTNSVASVAPCSRRSSSASVAPEGLSRRRSPVASAAPERYSPRRNSVATDSRSDLENSLDGTHSADYFTFLDASSSQDSPGTCTCTGTGTCTGTDSASDDPTLKLSGQDLKEFETYKKTGTYPSHQTGEQPSPESPRRRSGAKAASQPSTLRGTGRKNIDRLFKAQKLKPDTGLSRNMPSPRKSPTIDWTKKNKIYYEVTEGFNMTTDTTLCRDLRVAYKVKDYTREMKVGERYKIVKNGGGMETL